MFNYRPLSTFAIAAMTLGLLSGCNTMEGAGEDLEEAGEELEDSAEDNRNY